jgi:bifunctional non-homologous end joining protein LigD
MTARKPVLGKLPGAVLAPLPRWIEPQLCQLVKGPREGDAWLSEIKWDGYRMLTRIEAGDASVLSRNNNDWTFKFSTLAAAMARLKVRSAWLDGEVVIQDDKGRSDFHALKIAIGARDQARMQYFVFDLMYLDGYDLRGVPLIDRKRLLEALLTPGTAKVHYNGHIAGSGTAFYNNACKQKLEGAVAKRADSIYSGRRDGNWVKVKCLLRQEFVIGGYTEPENTRTGIGGLVLGVYEGKNLAYTGNVGTGFDGNDLAELRRKLTPLVQPAPPFVNAPKGYQAKGMVWCKPQLVAEVAFAEWTPSGKIRHASYQGLREDKKAQVVVRERELEAA